MLGIGHSIWISLILVLGSRQPIFVTFVANQFETVKQHHEKEVHSLLDKLQPKMIMLDPETISAVQHS